MAQEMAIGQILSIDPEMVLDANLTGLQGMAQEMAIGQIPSIDPEMVLDANLTGLQGMAQEMAIGLNVKWIGVEEVLCNPMIMIVGLATDLQEMVIGQILSIDLEMVLDV